MATNNRSGYEAWWYLTKLRELQGENSLRHIIGAALAVRQSET
jgi:hypothetical protein